MRLPLNPYKNYKSLPPLLLPTSDDETETLTVIDLVRNIVQLVDYNGRLTSKSAPFYQPSKGVFPYNVHIETATGDLILLNNKFKHAAASAFS
jgi:hypothetical protein